MRLVFRKRALYSMGVVLGLFICVFCGGIRLSTPLIYFNESGSLPVGWYLTIPMEKLHEGDLVIMKVPNKIEELVIERGLMKKDAAFIKRIGGLPGETYHIDDQKVEVCGKYVGPIFEVDREGRPMPKLRGDFVIKEGNFLPIADARPNSFDGRYFGEVSIATIKAKVVPLIVFSDSIF